MSEQETNRVRLRKGKCRKNERRWRGGPAGPAGATGATGPAGATGADGAAANAGFTYKVGDTGPGGGPIFFVDYYDQFPGFKYLEAAPADSSTGIAWCNVSTSVSDLASWAANAVGRGQENTTKMLSACTAGAAYSADSYTSPNGKDDWSLPSVGEFILMYLNLRQAGVGGFASDGYWSSGEFDATFAWVQNFNYGTQLYVNKSSASRVRPVRAFSN